LTSSSEHAAPKHAAAAAASGGHEFTTPQIVELLTWIAFEYAGQLFGCLIGDEPATAKQKRRSPPGSPASQPEGGNAPRTDTR
jgi:hypothetical protein